MQIILLICSDEVLAGSGIILTMKRIAVFVLVVVISLIVVYPAQAVDSSSSATQEASNIGQVVQISGGAVSSVGTGSISVSSEGKSITVTVLGSTKLRPKFWGSVKLLDFTKGDVVNVYGKWADEEQTTINASLIRDSSIQKYNGVFVGTVGSVSADGFVLNTFNRGVQTVTVSSTTKFTDQKGESLTQADVAVGNFVRVRGMWDGKAKMIMEVTTVKDYSLPAKVIIDTSTSSGASAQ